MRGGREAIRLYNKMLTKVPAYKSFLSKNKFGNKKISNISQFRAIPISSKENYRYKFPSKKLLWEDDVPKMLYSSSGSSGTPTYWHSGDISERRDGELHGHIFTKVFGINKNSETLVIVSFTMGLWIAGLYTAFAGRYLNSKGFKITTITPGVEKESIASIFRDIAPEYETVVLAGYPPFITDIVNFLVKSRTIPKNFKILTGGDKFTEDWRQAIRKKLKYRLKNSDIANIYGTSDAGIIAYETQLSIFLRSKSAKNRNLYRDLFGDAILIPGLSQFDPKEIYIEIIDTELVLTINGSTPLTRYNIHDTGKVFSPSQIVRILKKNKLYTEAKKSCAGSWNLPFVSVDGRTDVAITFYALNIYPEHIKACLNTPKIRNLVSGNCVAYTNETGSFKTERFYVDVELREGILPSKVNRRLISKTLAETILKVNIEYRKLHKLLDDAVLPKVKLVKYGSLNPEARNVKALAYTLGKKPRILLK